MQRLWNALLWVPGSSLILQSPARLWHQCSGQSATNLRETPELTMETGDMAGRNTSVTSSLGAVVTTYSRMMEEMRDPRVDSWLLMDSIWPTLSLSASYYLIVRYIGPWFMEKRWYWYWIVHWYKHTILQYINMNFAGSLTIWNPLCRFTTFSKLFSILGFSTKSACCGRITMIGTVNLWTIRTGLYIFLKCYQWQCKLQSMQNCTTIYLEFDFMLNIAAGQQYWLRDSILQISKYYPESTFHI